jgi:serine/threonine-protein kinase HipA
MALRGKRNHYRLREIQPRHWHSLAERAGAPDLWQRMIDFVESVPATLDTVAATLPADFPPHVIDKIATGTQQEANTFLAAASRL